MVLRLCIAMLTLGLAMTCASASEQPSIAIVMVDTLRADLADARAPNIRSLCKKGRSFPNANSTTPSTRSSVASLLTGVGPEVHGVRHGQTHLNDFRGARLAKLLKKQGYNTYAFVTNPNVDSVFGHNAGFDEYHELYRKTERKLQPATSDELVTDAGALAKALEGATLKKPYFVFVLAIDPHRPYTPPGHTKCQDPESWSKHCYRAEVEYFDSQLPRLLDVFEGATIVFTSDHGEEFREHGELGHGKNVFETSTHIPLCIAGAGKEEQLERVDMLDVSTTVAKLAGADVPRSWLGRDLLSSKIERRYVMSLWEPQKAYRWETKNALRPRERLFGSIFRQTRASRTLKSGGAPRQTPRPSRCSRASVTSSSHHLPPGAPSAYGTNASPNGLKPTVTDLMNVGVPSAASA